VGTCQAQYASEGWELLTLLNSREANTVGTGDKIENKADVLKGKVKETAGQASDDPELTAEGQGDQAKGHVKQAGEKVKDAAKDVFGQK
jgi:uncharacterized protein YjbJ (UPF0337 family)